MKELKQLLAEGDPVAREPGLSDVDLQAMRRTIVVESWRRPEPVPTSLWPRPLALAVALAACLTLGVGIGLRPGGRDLPGTPRPVAPTSDVRRQLQITSPGGTRIIWTFHQELSL
jgi:hypothetical protein